MNPKLDYNQAVCLLELEQQCTMLLKEIINKLETIEAINAVSLIKKAWQRVFAYSTSPRADDGLTLRRVNELVRAVECADATLEDVYKSRRVRLSDHATIKRQTTIISARMYRVLWDKALSREDRKLLSEIFTSMGVYGFMRFWEGIPWPWNCAQYNAYAQLSYPISGMTLFAHCCGYTFVEYKEGRANGKAWSVSLEAVDEAVRVARTAGVEIAAKLISCP